MTKISPVRTELPTVAPVYASGIPVLNKVLTPVTTPPAVTTGAATVSTAFARIRAEYALGPAAATTTGSVGTPLPGPLTNEAVVTTGAANARAEMATVAVEKNPAATGRYISFSAPRYASEPELAAVNSLRLEN